MILRTQYKCFMFLDLNTRDDVFHLARVQQWEVSEERLVLLIGWLVRWLYGNEYYRFPFLPKDTQKVSNTSVIKKLV